MEFLSPAAVLLDCHNLGDRSKRKGGRKSCATLSPIYFPLNFHHAFNNTTCITINLRSGDRPIKRAGLSDSDSGGGYGGAGTSIHHRPFVACALCRAKLSHVRLRRVRSRIPAIPTCSRGLRLGIALDALTALHWLYVDTRRRDKVSRRAKVALPEISSVSEEGCVSFLQEVSRFSRRSSCATCKRRGGMKPGDGFQTREVIRIV